MAWLLIGILCIHTQPVRRLEFQHEFMHTHMVEAEFSENFVRAAASGGQKNASDLANGQSGVPEKQGNNWKDAFRPSTWSNWLLAIVGLLAAEVAILTLFVIAWQAVETRKAAEATKRSTALQEIQFQQWLVFENWRHSFPSADRLQIQVDISNHTNFAITFENAIFRVGTEEQRSYGKHLMPPKSCYTLDFSRTLTSHELLDIQAGTIVFGMRGGVWFTGILGKQFQPIGGLIEIGRRKGVVFTPQSAHEQSAQEHYGVESPN